MSEAGRVNDVKSEQETPSTENRVAELEVALEEALAERNRLWEALNRERADQSELEDRKREIHMIYATRMWKIAGRYQRVKQALLSALGRSPES